ncbi:MAG: sensor histidine kinase [Acidimicrobiales bacterium]
MQTSRVRTGLGGRASTAGRRLVATQEGLLVAGLVLALLATIEIVLVSDLDSDRSGTALSTAILLGLGATLPIAAVRLHVVAATAAIASAAILAVLTDERPTVAGSVALAVSIFWLGARHRWPVAALMVVPFVAHAAFAMADPGTTNGRAVAMAAVTMAAVGVGRARQLRGRARARDASHQSMTAAFLEYEARGERARIARELHDVVAHHISMIAVQAETARLATPGMPADGARQLRAIGDTARTALTEMRRLLGVLREDADTGPTRQPQPGLSQLVELVDDARAWANATTRLVVQGCVAPLDPGIELTAYRIVQEALTNARRHAPGAPVDVELDYTPAALLVRVRDNGPGPSGAITANGSPTGRHGLRGMRERAAAVGGDLRVGSPPVGGFLVEATLPATGRATEGITG